jgi:6-pyruvoyltetrahydropterin/6-carboxytetrahydropterin synthase
MTKITLHTKTSFDAAHKLDEYIGKCSQLHGHTWTVEVWIKGEVEHRDKAGILFDFNKVKDLVKRLDHEYLNSVLGFNPTAENLVLFFYAELKNKNPFFEFKVRVFESKNSYAEIGDF